MMPRSVLFGLTTLLSHSAAIAADISHYFESYDLFGKVMTPTTKSIGEKLVREEPSGRLQIPDYGKNIALRPSRGNHYGFHGGHVTLSMQVNTKKEWLIAETIDDQSLGEGAKTSSLKISTDTVVGGITINQMPSGGDTLHHADIGANAALSEYSRRNLAMLKNLDPLRKAWAERAVPYLDNVSRFKPNTDVTVETVEGEIIVSFVPGEKAPPTLMRASYYAQVLFDARTEQYKRFLLGP